MEQQKDLLITEEICDLSEVEKSKKLRYLTPEIAITLVELESHIAAGSITVTQENQEVQEGWEEDNLVRDIEIDLY